MSRSRQGPPTPQVQPSPVQPSPVQPPQPENMDIVAQAMASLSPRHEQGQEFPQGTSFNQGANSFPANVNASGFPHRLPQQYPGATQFQNFDSLNDDFQRLALNPKEYVCDLYDKEIVNKKGIVIQYLNSNSTGATNAIGVTRVNVTDPRRMPQYLTRNLTYIRQHAVSCLQTHMRLTLCAAGALEKLTAEDFSISFSWASLTDVGRSLCLPGRNDLALGFAGCESLLMPILINKSDLFPTYVINAYIYLQDTTRRSTTVIAKAKEDAVARANPDRPKYVKKFPNHNNYNDRTLETVASMAANQALVQNESMKRAAPTLFDHFPPLPSGPGPEWNVTGRAPLPDE